MHYKKHKPTSSINTPTSYNHVPPYSYPQTYPQTYPPSIYNTTYPPPPPPPPPPAPYPYNYHPGYPPYPNSAPYPSTPYPSAPYYNPPYSGNYFSLCQKFWFNSYLLNLLWHFSPLLLKLIYQLLCQSMWIYVTYLYIENNHHSWRWYMCTYDFS